MTLTGTSACLNELQWKKKKEGREYSRTKLEKKKNSERHSSSVKKEVLFFFGKKTLDLFKWRIKNVKLKISLVRKSKDRSSAKQTHDSKNK